MFFKAPSYPCLRRSIFKAFLSGGSFFAHFQAVLKVGAQAIFPFKKLVKRKMGKLPGRLLGIITNEKGPYDSLPLVPFKAVLRHSYPC